MYRSFSVLALLALFVNTGYLLAQNMPMEGAVCTPLLSTSPGNCHVGDTICYSGYVSGAVLGPCQFCSGDDAINFSICIGLEGYTCPNPTPLNICQDGDKIAGECVPFEGTAICVNQRIIGTCDHVYSSCKP
jgi:hypothetical protein